MRSGIVGLVAAWVAAVVVLGGGVTRAAEPAGGRVVVMVSVDGLAGFYMDDPKAEMPVIRGLAREGAWAEGGMRVSTPSVTWPNHATLMTGVSPARHGVVGNNYLERGTWRRVMLIADPELDKDQVLRVPAVFDAAKAAGLTTLAVRWPVTRNARALDWTVPDVGSAAAMEPLTTPAVLEAAKAAGVWYEGGEGWRETRDDRSVAIFTRVLVKHRPAVGLLHLDRVDHVQHLHGPRSAEAYAAIREADRQVGVVWETVKKEFPGRAALIVVSDHGFSAIERVMLPNVILREAGLVDVKGLRVVGGAVRVLVQGGSAFVYVVDGAKREEVIGRVRKAFDGVEGVGRVIAGAEEFREYGVADPKDEPRAPDAIVLAKEGYTFGDTAGGALAFQDKPERKGSHGHDPNIPNLHGTFVVCGAGVKGGVRLGTVSNTDVAPTMAKLAGFEMKGTDGRPLVAGE